MSREMKHSGIPWIGDIPKGWCVNLLSSLFDEHKQKNKGLVETNLLSLSYGKIIRKDINTKEGLLPESFDGYNVISSGDIVFRLTDLQNDKRSLRTGLCTENGIITSAYVTIRGRHSLNSAYYHYLFHSYDLCKVFYGMGEGVRQGMNYGDLRKLLILLPSLSEQQKIASFLDGKCSEIDEMIALQEKIVDELKAYKQSVITEAVTKGLNPDAPMKDSGIEWIGEFPEHWELLRIKNILKEVHTITPTGEGEKLSVTQNGGIIKTSEIEVANPSLSTIGWKVVSENDIVFNKYKAHSGVFFVSPYNGIVTFNYSVYRCYDDYIPKFYEYVFKTVGCISEFRKEMRGVGESISPLYTKDLLSINIYAPPKSEQESIIKYLNKKCTEIDNLISIKLSKIDSLKEYKKSIIYEYVTGKKEVIE